MLRLHEQVKAKELEAEADVAELELHPGQEGSGLGGGRREGAEAVGGRAPAADPLEPSPQEVRIGAVCRVILRSGGAGTEIAPPPPA